MANPGLHHVPTRPHRMALLGRGEDGAHIVLVDATSPKFERCVERDDIIVDWLGHSSAANTTAARFRSPRPLVVSAVFTGLRASELRGLTWSAVDLDRRTLTIVQA